MVVKRLGALAAWTSYSFEIPCLIREDDGMASPVPFGTRLYH
jgi:hypothetical protein